MTNNFVPKRFDVVHWYESRVSKYLDLNKVQYSVTKSSKKPGIVTFRIESDHNPEIIQSMVFNHFNS